jgi:hypothetical protein
MTAAALNAFRDLAEQMIGRADWEWVGPHMSQRMFGITQERAEGYAKAHGGTARKMGCGTCGRDHETAACPHRFTGPVEEVL